MRYYTLWSRQFIKWISVSVIDLKKTALGYEKIFADVFITKFLLRLDFYKYLPFLRATGLSSYGILLIFKNKIMALDGCDIKS